MKTLVLLCTLVCTTFAAPAQPGDGLEDTKRYQDWHVQVQSNLPDNLKREKKSPSEIATSSVLNTAAAITDVHNVQHIDSGASTGRSFTVMKPLIVKKKHGYKLYRDSEEEKAQADPHETCGRQVKVKLCDEDVKFKKEMMSSSAHESNRMSEDDVKHSIKMAKEAVENLQRDLKKMEQKTAMKTAQEAETDNELHEDIEVARKALEHIHENFGNLETMNLHATTSRDSETMHNVHVTIAKTEEERMAQWKEAIQNIQKNVEIARNLEGSFKVASHQDGLVHLDQSESVAPNAEHRLEQNLNTHAALTAESLMRATEHAGSEMTKEGGEGKLFTQETNEQLTELNAREEQSTESDMDTAASGVIETNVNERTNLVSLGSDDLGNEEQEKSAEVHLENHHEHALIKELETQEKSSDVNLDMATDQSEVHLSQLPFMKTLEQEVETKTDVDKDALFKTPENILETLKDSHLDSHITSTNSIKPLTSDIFTEQEKSAELDKDIETIEEHLKDEKSAWDNTSDDMIDFLAKATEPMDHDKMDTENVQEELKHNEELEKTAEILKPEHQEQVTEVWNVKPKEAVQALLVDTKHEEKFDQIPKSAEQTDFTIMQNIPEQSESFMLAKSADQSSLLDLQKQHMIENKQLSHVDTKLHDHISSMKMADEIKKEFEVTHGNSHGLHIQHPMEQMRSSHLVEHSQIPHKMSGKHDFELASHVNDMKHVKDNSMITEHPVDHVRSSHFDEHSQIPSKVSTTHDFEVSRHANEMTHGNGHGMITEHPVNQFRSSHFDEHSQIPSKVSTTHDFEVSRHANEMTHGNGHGMITEHPVNQFRSSHFDEHSQIPSKVSTTHEFELSRHANEMTHGNGHGMITEHPVNQFRSSHFDEHSQIPSKVSTTHEFELSSHANKMTHGNGHGMITDHPVNQFRSSHFGEHSQIPSKMSATHDFELSSHVNEMTHGNRHEMITDHPVDQLRSSHFGEHSQIPSKISATHDFELSGHAQSHLHHPARYHNQMKHLQMHDMNGIGSAVHSNFHPSMRDAMEGFGSEHMFRWKPSHESGRSAYGSGLSSSIGSAGAVGVFPNANTGGCGIPLLLSCSPSVVSGSLAKAHSAGPASYSSPAYRTEDEFTFHNKRDIKKTNDMRTTNALRTPIIVKQKNPMPLENKS